MTEEKKPKAKRLSDRIKAMGSFAWWLVTNDIDLSLSEKRREYFETLKHLEFGKSRTGDLRKYAEEEFKETAAGLKEANDRVDKLLGLTLIAIGWVATQAFKDKLPLSWSLCALIASSVILLCGRWKVTSRMPESFPGFVELAKESGPDEDVQFAFDVARQYHKATYDNGRLAGLTQIRLLISAILLTAGLIAFALRM